MNRVGKFEKVSYDQFKEAISKVVTNLSENDIKAMYEDIQLPVRATSGSAGYDFRMPCDMTIDSVNHPIILIPTGIRVKISDGWKLSCYPRSGLGFKYGIRLRNTVGIIDSDYYNSSNEGHIMIKLEINSKDYLSVDLKKGDKFVQGIFEVYGITEDDEASGVRDGGMGSTDKR